MNLDALAATTVTDETGKEIKVGDLWRDKTAVIVWVRHFGWMFCREHVVQLHRKIDDIHRAGAELYVIGSGTPNFIKGFREVTHFEGPIYSDPQLASYQAAGLKHSMLANMTPAVMGRGIRAMFRGHFQGRTQGDPSQQGGAVVVAPGGKVLYAQVSGAAGDNAPPEEIVAALTTGSDPASARM